MHVNEEGLGPSLLFGSQENVVRVGVSMKEAPVVSRRE
jgi:hypothetical protein